MAVKHAVLAASALAILAAPVAASADPWWGEHERGDYGWRGDHDGHEWREHEHDRWEGRAYYGERAYYGDNDGWGGYGRCFWTRQGHYNWWGQYEYRSVRICR
jgi:hypothetical protein